MPASWVEVRCQRSGESDRCRSQSNTQIWLKSWFTRMSAEKLTRNHASTPGDIVMPFSRRVNFASRHGFSSQLCCFSLRSNAAWSEPVAKRRVCPDFGVRASRAEARRGPRDVVEGCGLQATTAPLRLRAASFDCALRCSAAHDVQGRDVSLAICRNGPCVADPLNMTIGTSWVTRVTPAGRHGSTQDDSPPLRVLRYSLPHSANPKKERRLTDTCVRDRVQKTAY